MVKSKGGKRIETGGLDPPVCDSTLMLPKPKPKKKRGRPKGSKDKEPSWKRMVAGSKTSYSTGEQSRMGRVLTEEDAKEAVRAKVLQTGAVVESEMQTDAKGENITDNGNEGHGLEEMERAYEAAFEGDTGQVRDLSSGSLAKIHFILEKSLDRVIRDGVSKPQYQTARDGSVVIYNEEPVVRGFITDKGRLEVIATCSKLLDLTGDGQKVTPKSRGTIKGSAAALASMREGKNLLEAKKAAK